MVVCVHTVVMCVVLKGETPYKYVALESCFPVGFYRAIDPHSGFVCSHSGCLCCAEEEGGGPDKHGALNAVFH